MDMAVTLDEESIQAGMKKAKDEVNKVNRQLEMEHELLQVKFRSMMSDIGRRDSEVAVEYCFGGHNHEYQKTTASTPDDGLIWRSLQKDGPAMPFKTTNNIPGVKFYVDEDLPDGIIAFWNGDAVRLVSGPTRSVPDVDPCIEAMKSKLESLNGEYEYSAPKPQKKYQSMKHLDFETVLKLIEIERKNLKQQGKEWIHFQDATGYWDSKIRSAFSVNERYEKHAGENAVKLADRGFNFGLTGLALPGCCVMGKTFDKGNPWSDDGYGYVGRDNSCIDCGWLASPGLNLFTNFSHRFSDKTICPTSWEGFEEYKAKWEYHMNTAHR